MRGMLGHPPGRVLHDRIIPAYAGNATCRRRWLRMKSDHPRVCGECARHRHRGFDFIGSSPRMRGMLPKCVPGVMRTRIIPAYAGNARPRPIPVGVPADHPRVCGECSSRLSSNSRAIGSSPRMRGMQLSAGQQRHDERIIPAYAGNAVWKISRRGMNTDHPRVCGECRLGCCHIAAEYGSSPRMRGMPHRRRDSSLQRRIIPAYAGNASVHSAFLVLVADHPRVCGECARIGSQIVATDGSSPRMRGMRHSPRRSASTARIIPAYAGNARCCSARSSVAADQPRVCGECNPG